VDDTADGSVGDVVFVGEGLLGNTIEGVAAAYLAYLFLCESMTVFGRYWLGWWGDVMAWTKE